MKGTNVRKAIISLAMVFAAATPLYADKVVVDGITWECITQPAPDYLLPQNDNCSYLICESIPSLRDVVVPSEVNGLPVVYLRFENAVIAYIRSLTVPSSVKTVTLGYSTSLKWVKMEESKPYHDATFDFCGCTALTNAVVCGQPEQWAFRNCKNLRSVTMLGAPVKLGQETFVGCEKLEEIEIPESCTIWGLDMFSGCKKLKRVNIPYGTTCFDPQDALVDVKKSLIGTFRDCQSLEDIVLPESINYLNGAFAGCSRLSKINFPAALESIYGAFQGCAFEDLDVPGTVKLIGGGTFGDNISLTNIVFGEGLRMIGGSLFNGCENLRRVVLPASLENITPHMNDSGSAAESVDCLFAQALYPDEIVVPEESPYFEMTNGLLVQKYAEPKTVKWAVWGLTDVVLPSGIERVPAGLFEGWRKGRDGTLMHYPIRSVIIPEGVKEIGSGAFVGCRDLTKVDFPSTLTDIEDGAFGGTGLSELTLPDALEYIHGGSAFFGCENLKCVTIPASVVDVGISSFPSYMDVAVFLGDMPDNLEQSNLLTAKHIYYPRRYESHYWPHVDEAKFAGYSEDLPKSPTMTFVVGEGSSFSVSREGYGFLGDAWPDNPVREGCDFLGWYSLPEGGVKVDSTTIMTTNSICYAQWTTATCMVTFNANGGTVAPSEKEYLAEAPYGELPEPVREHFAFAGWWTEASGGSRVEISSEVPKAAHELFAHWTPCNYTIRFHANNGTDASVDQYFTYGDTVTLRANSFGYGDKIFVGWALSEDGPAVYADGKTLTDVAAIQDNVIHLYAVWVSTRYTVRFDSHGGVGRMENQTIVKDTAAALYGCAFTRTGYTFAGWAVSTTGVVVYGDGERVVNVYEKTGANVVLYAVWEPIIYSIHYSANGGIGTMADQSMTYDKSVRLAAVSFVKDGAVFKGWSTAENGAMVYPDGVSVKNLASIYGAVVTLYAVWLEEGAPWPLPKPEPVLEPELYDEDEVVGAAPVAAASEYNGYLYDVNTGAVAGTIQVKVGKPKAGLAAVKATVVVGAAKASLKADGGGKAAIAENGPTTIQLVGGESCEVTLGAEGLSGSYGSYLIDGARNFFTSKDNGEQGAANAILETWIGAVNVAWGGGNASVSIGKKGKAKVAVTLADGTKATANAQLLVGEEWLCVPVVVTKKTSLAFTLWLPRGGGAAVVEGLSGDTVAGKPGALGANAAFRVGKSAALWQQIPGTALADYLPDGMAVTQSGAKWTLPKAGKVQKAKDGTIDSSKLGENPSALKLTYKAKDGSFKGSFKVYADNGGKLKATTVNVTGVVINGVGYGTATIKKVGSVPVKVE